MKNTIENKAKLFAQYCWQTAVLELPEDTYVETLVGIHLEDIMNGAERFVLQLKPISAISDEDLKYIWDLEEFEDEFNANLRASHFLLMEDCGVFEKYSTVDYLRTKGFALPWNGITVEEQIEFGWVILAK